MAKKRARREAARRTAASRSRRAATRRPTRPKAARRTARRKTKAATRPAGRSRRAPRAKAAGRTKAAGRKTAARRAAVSGQGKGALRTKRPPALERPRRTLAEEPPPPGPPSSLDFERAGGGVRTGRDELRQSLRDHTETGPALTGGDVDADWETAYSSGETAPGGDMPSPDQDRVEDIGRALGVEYQDAEPLKGTEKIVDRDRHRWEYDPASSEDYRERTRREEPGD